MRYWVYVHDLDGEIIEDLGDYSHLNDALATLFEFNYYNPLEMVGRVVDNNNESQTVYITGPVAYMKECYNEAR